MKKSYKLLSCILSVAVFVSNTVPVMASDNGVGNTSNVLSQASISITDDGITINGTYYTISQFEELLETAEVIEIPATRPQTRSAIAGVAAGVYFIPGVGEVLIAATGAVIVGGVAITASSWAYKKIVSYFKEHTKNKSKRTHDKHTKPRPGRDKEKKKDPKKGWKPRNKKH